MKKVIFLLTITSFLLTSCATIFTGSKDTIYFSSSPEGARVFIDGREICQTPCHARIKKGFNSKSGKMRLDGYEARVFTMDTEFNPVSIINLFNAIGWLIDTGTGALMKYSQKGYNIEFDEEDKLSNLDPVRIEVNTHKKTLDIYIMEGK